jgi:hypothetical protein
MFEKQRRLQAAHAMVANHHGFHLAIQHFMSRRQLSQRQ